MLSPELNLQCLTDAEGNIILIPLLGSSFANEKEFILQRESYLTTRAIHSGAHLKAFYSIKKYAI